MKKELWQLVGPAWGPDKREKILLQFRGTARGVSNREFMKNEAEPQPLYLKKQAFVQ